MSGEYFSNKYNYLQKYSTMLNITNQRFFCEIIADAVVQIHLTCSDLGLRDRWINAIAKAAAIILEGDLTFLHWNPVENILYFWSTDSDEIYQTAVECQCPAYLQKNPQPCYHRAMWRLIKNYFDFLQKPNEISQIDFADAVFFDFCLPIKEKIRLLNMSIVEGRTELKPRVEVLQNALAN